MYLSGVHIICFVASYAVAFGGDLVALFWCRPLFRLIARGWLIAGFIAHTAYLIYHPLASPDRFLTDERTFFLVAAWVLVPVCLYLTCRRKGTPFPLFFLPVILLLLGLGTLGASSSELLASTAVPLWRTLHIIAFLFVLLSLTIGGVAGLMYIHQDRRLKKRHNPSDALQLPSLEWSGNLARDAIVLAQYSLILGVFSGLVMGYQLAHLAGTNPISLTDPLVLGGLALCIAVSVLVLSPAWRYLLGRRRALLSLLLLTILLLVLFTAVLSPQSHWKGKEVPSPPSREEGLR